MAEIFVGVGSNYRRCQSIRQALLALEKSFGALDVSPVYESAALDPTQSNYFNLAVGFASATDADSVWETLKSIERDAGRVRGSPEVCLDLDLLLYDELMLETARFALPHRDVLNRAYVLKPLADIAPQRRHPMVGKSYAQLWREMSADAPELSDVSACLRKPAR